MHININNNNKGKYDITYRVYAIKLTATYLIITFLTNQALDKGCVVVVAQKAFDLL